VAVVILAIDPGPVESAWVTYANGRPHYFAKQPNHEGRDVVADAFAKGLYVCIEMIASYGMPVGAEVFETCLWIGRFAEVDGDRAERLTRSMVKLHLCQSPRANDATVRQAILDRYGGKDAAIGKKKTPGPLYGLHGDCWAALAVAITASETGKRYVWPPINPAEPATQENNA
jgi:hypothetical protein